MARDVSPAADASGAPVSRPRRWYRRWWIRMWIYLLIAIVVWALSVWFAQRSVMFPRYLITVPAQSALPGDAERWQLDAAAGAVEAWFLRGDGVSPDTPGPAVIFAHGNGEIIDGLPRMLEAYQEMGVSVLLPEFRGYGRSAGSPSQAAITQDYLAFHDRLVQHAEVDADRIVFHGRSIGNGVLASVARQRAPDAWICESSFISAAAMARRYFVPRFMVRDPFEVRNVLEQYQGPVLILHGRQDTIIPPHHSQQLHAAAPQSELILYDGMGHNDMPPLDRYWRDIEQFLKNAGILVTGTTSKPAPGVE